MRSSIKTIEVSEELTAIRKEIISKRSIRGSFRCKRELVKTKTSILLVKRLKTSIEKNIKMENPRKW
jgi:hypothetical protein